MPTRTDLVASTRRSLLVRRLAAAVLAVAAAPVALAADANWPQWRGPSGTGTAAAEANPPAEWSETKNVKWKVKLPGEGSGTPIVWGDKIFVQVAVSTGKTADGPAAAGSPDDAPPAAQPQQPA
ncbi:MAG TPA: hypothetical protein VF796_11145, partial [Humisphaera sp.]